MNSGISSDISYNPEQLGKICMGCLEATVECFGECGCVLCQDCQECEQSLNLVTRERQTCSGCGEQARKYVSLSMNPVIPQMRPFFSDLRSSLEQSMFCVDMQMKVKNKQIKVLINRLREAKERIAQLESVNEELNRKKKIITKKYKEIKNRDTPQPNQSTCSSVSMIQDLSGYSSHQDSIFKIPLPKRPIHSPNFTSDQSIYSQGGLLSTASSIALSPTLFPSQQTPKERGQLEPKAGCKKTGTRELRERTQWRTSQQMSQRAKRGKGSGNSSSTSTRGTRSGRRYNKF